MSLRPAVLYDHVPTAIPDDDDDDSEDKNKETLGVSYYVSKMVHRISAPPAPRQEKDSNNNNSCDVQQFQVLEREQGNDDDNNGSDHDEKYRDETIDKSDNDHHHNKGDSESDDDDDDDDDDDLRPMETIIEDTDSDYILIPIPSSATMTMTTTNGENNNEILLATTHRRTIKRIRKQLRDLCNLIFNNTIDIAIASSESNNRHNNSQIIWNVWKAKIRATITKPISYYLRNLPSSSIYSSYDWVSETVIDIHGGPTNTLTNFRLILPGACVDLDTESEINSMIDHNNNNNDTGTLIVPACTDSGILKGEDFATRIYSPLLSTTIMVSAYDILAVERNNQQIKRRINNNTDTPQSLSLFETIEEEHRGGSRDCRYYYRDDDDEDYQSTMIMVATTIDVTQQWKHALWKLVKRKTNRWYYVGYFRFQQTIQSVGQLLIDSQQLLLKCNNNSNSSNRIHRGALLLLLSNFNANGTRKGVLLDTNDSDKTDEQDVLDPTIFDSTRSSQYTTSTRTIEDDEGVVIIEMSSCKSNHYIRSLPRNEL
ncbi:MAG: hypothetical protein ACI8RD_000266 [Bacillariaceae sp.]|jgi:hypothetical protein